MYAIFITTYAVWHLKTKKWEGGLNKIKKLLPSDYVKLEKVKPLNL